MFAWRLNVSVKIGIHDEDMEVTIYLKCNNNIITVLFYLIWVVSLAATQIMIISILNGSLKTSEATVANYVNESHAFIQKQEYINHKMQHTYRKVLFFD